MNQEYRSKYALVIPARYQSSRFPGKPLARILGKEMILRVWEKCIQAVDDPLVWVATDDDRIMDFCKQSGIQVVRTDSACMTGTDRVYEAIRGHDLDFVINVQGDEPLIDPNDIAMVIDAARKDPASIINAMCPIDNEKDFLSRTVPKVVCRRDGRLLYMSRSPIPITKSGTFEGANKQVCIYSFPVKALEAFYSVTEKTPLENIEDIEILRFLEMGFDVKMVPVSRSSIAVDIPEDLERVEAYLRAES
jgi:3-deoxy-manno-octulosonate cytidylyltransferase (CMP-KDO synthetase)